jgi:hypothetical protein
MKKQTGVPGLVAFGQFGQPVTQDLLVTNSPVTHLQRLLVTPLSLSATLSEPVYYNTTCWNSPSFAVHHGPCTLRGRPSPETVRTPSPVPMLPPALLRLLLQAGRCTTAAAAP